MEIDTITSRLSEGFQYVDQFSQTETIGKHGAYLPGLPSMNERAVVAEAVDFWFKNYSSEFSDKTKLATEVVYPESARSKADIVLTSKSSKGSEPEWAIEVKRFQFVGDNGKNNDFGVAKMFSPYLKDRSLAHDAQRLAMSTVAKRKAVLVYGFEYNLKLCAQSARIHPDHIERINSIQKVCKINDSESPHIDFDPLITRVSPNLAEVVNVVGFTDLTIENLWRHPCGGQLRVLCWEVSAL